MRAIRNCQDSFANHHNSSSNNLDQDRMLADLKMRGKILVRSPIQNSPSSRLYQGYLDFIFFFLMFWIMAQQSAILSSNCSLGNGLSSHSIILLLAYFCVFGHCTVAPFKPFLNFRSKHFFQRAHEGKPLFPSVRSERLCCLFKTCYQGLVEVVVCFS